MVLYEGSTQVTTYTLRATQVGVFTTANLHYFMFPTPQALTKDTAYRVTLQPSSNTAFTFTRFSVDANATLGAFPGGIQFYETYRTNAGSFTDVTTNRPNIGIILDQFDDAVSAGGGGGSYGFVK